MSIFPDRFRLDGRTALITGSGRGLGWEMAKALAEAGARILLHGRSRERLGPRLDDLKTAGYAAGGLCFDMADRASMRAEVSKAGAIDILIHNVGERDRRPLADIEPQDFARLVDVDLSAAHALIKLVVLSRHGVRSPLESSDELQGWTATSEWPAWSCPNPYDPKRDCQPGWPSRTVLSPPGR